MHSSKRDSDKATLNQQVRAAQVVDPDPWRFFDRVYCISLEHREDRRREAMRQFASVGLEGRVEFLTVAKHPTDCEQGIYASHLECLARGLAAGAAHILVFEDDVVFEDFSPHVLTDAVEGLQRQADWEVLFLGCMVKRSESTACSALVRIRYRSLTHAYGINRSFAKTLVRHHPWRGIAYDDLLRDLCGDNMYAVYPGFAFQSDSASDNDVYLPLDRFRRLCGGLRSLQKKNEWYNRYRWWVIGGHCLVLLALAAWL